MARRGQSNGSPRRAGPLSFGVSLLNLMPLGSDLPPGLTRYLADAEAQVITCAGPEGRLVVRITKEIGPESGLLTFSGVNRIHMPARLTIEGIACGGLEVLPAGYLGPPEDSLDPSDRVFVVREPWGAIYYVVAESAAYEADG